MQTHQLERNGHLRAPVAVTLEVQGQPSADQLTQDLTEVHGVIEVTTTDLAGGTE